MADSVESKKSKHRRLKTPVETVRERAQNASNNSPKAGWRSKLRSFFAKIGAARIWKPFKFIGRYIIPPYFRNSWRELRDVTWTNRKETRQLTSAVILFSIIFGAVVAAADYGLDKLFKEVLLK